MSKRFGVLTFVGGWLALAWCVASHTAYAQEVCRFEAPVGWGKPHTRWLGPCADGLAHGLGVLKETQGGQAKRFFFGRLNRGAVELGVIEETQDETQGYRAGRFAQGAVVASDDRQTYVDAFDAAQKAAHEVAQRFRASGNAASAKYYADKAKTLSEALD